MREVKRIREGATIAGAGTTHDGRKWRPATRGEVSAQNTNGNGTENVRVKEHLTSVGDVTHKPDIQHCIEDQHLYCVLHPKPAACPKHSITWVV